MRKPASVKNFVLLIRVIFVRHTDSNEETIVAQIGDWTGYRPKRTCRLQCTLACLMNDLMIKFTYGRCLVNWHGKCARAHTAGYIVILSTCKLLSNG